MVIYIEPATGSWSFLPLLPPTMAWVALGDERGRMKRTHHTTVRFEIRLKGIHTNISSRQTAWSGTHALMVGGEREWSIMKFIYTAIKHAAEADWYQYRSNSVTERVQWEKTSTLKTTWKEKEAKTQLEISVAAPSSAGQGQIKSGSRRLATTRSSYSQPRPDASPLWLLVVA